MFIYIDKILLSFFTLNSPSSFSYERLSSPLTLILALCWTHSSVSMSLLYWRAQDWIEHCRWDLTSAEERRRVTSLDLLKTHWPSLLQGKLAGSWSAWGPLRLPGLFLQSCFPTGYSQPLLVLGVIHPSVQDLAILLVELSETAVCLL